MDLIDRKLSQQKFGQGGVSGDSNTGLGGRKKSHRKVPVSWIVWVVSREQPTLVLGKLKTELVPPRSYGICAMEEWEFGNTFNFRCEEFSLQRQ